MDAFTNNSTTSDVSIESMLETMKLLQSEAVPRGQVVFMNPADSMRFPVMEPPKMDDAKLLRIRFSYESFTYKPVSSGILYGACDAAPVRDERPAKAGNGSLAIILVVAAVLAAAAAVIL